MKTLCTQTSPADLLNICRTCLDELATNKTSIFENITIETTGNKFNQDDGDEDAWLTIRIVDIIHLCTSNISVNEEEERISKFICEKCLSELRQFYRFRQQVIACAKMLENLKDAIESVANVTTSDTVFGDSNIHKNSGNTPDEVYTNEAMGNKCVVCGKVFSNYRRLQIHLVKKHSVRSDQNVVDKKYKCDRCEKSYTTRANLLIHERSHGCKAFECDHCHRAFYDANALINHTSIHTGIKKFNCEDCGKYFTTANILQQHRKKHSMAVRPHKCSKCPAAFYTPNDLRIHFLTHTRERLYLCCQCGKRFSRKTHLNIHLRTHSGLKPFQCKICQKSFAISGDLTAHMRIHTGDRPYACLYCEKTFNQSSARNIHLRIHYRKRSYVCHICNAGFTQSASLKRHMTIHMNTELPSETLNDEKINQ